MVFVACLRGYHYVTGFVPITDRAQFLLAIGRGRANLNTCRRPASNVTSRHVMNRQAGERYTPEPTLNVPVTCPCGGGNRSNRRPSDFVYIGIRIQRIFA